MSKNLKWNKDPNERVTIIKFLEENREKSIMTRDLAVFLRYDIKSTGKKCENKTNEQKNCNTSNFKTSVHQRKQESKRQSL
jgi:hypothetical protein